MKSLDVKFSSIKKEGISFDIHNMDGPYNSEFDIVYCRNVLLTTKRKKKQAITGWVKAGGILILGDTDPHIFEDNWKEKR